MRDVEQLNYRTVTLKNVPDKGGMETGYLNLPLLIQVRSSEQLKSAAEPLQRIIHMAAAAVKSIFHCYILLDC